MSERGFPNELFGQSEAKRLQHFKRTTIAHPLLKEVDTQLRRAIIEPGGATTVLVFGPTGVGKTTMLLQVARKLTIDWMSSLEINPGRIPIARFMVSAPDSHQFSWKDYYLSALLALSEPLVDKKKNYSDPPVSSQGQDPIRTPVRAGGSDLRGALISALQHRQVSALFVDEAQHLAKIASGRKLKDQMDCIKSLADQSKTIHVLFGTYELLSCRNQSGQLGRRSMDIHFRRYQTDRKQDLETFRNIIWNFQRAMPLADEPDLDLYWEYLYERSIGCVGVLKDWLTGALIEALNSKAGTLTLKHLERKAPSISRCVKMAQEAVEGERRLMEDEGSRSKLLSLLAIGVEPTKTLKINENTAVGKQSVVALPQKNGRICERRPKRDPIGVKNYAS